MTNERASKRQQELLSFVDGFIKENGYGPSYREIMTAIGYKSVSTVAIHIEGLIAKGYLARRDNSARSLEVVTTRPEISTQKATVMSDMQIEAELRRRLDALDDDEQKRGISESLARLGFASFARQEGDDETAV